VGWRWQQPTLIGPSPLLTTQVEEEEGNSSSSPTPPRHGADTTAGMAAAWTGRGSSRGMHSSRLGRGMRGRTFVQVCTHLQVMEWSEWVKEVVQVVQSMRGVCPSTTSTAVATRTEAEEVEVDMVLLQGEVRPHRG